MNRACISPNPGTERKSVGRVQPAFRSRPLAGSGPNVAGAEFDAGHPPFDLGVVIPVREGSSRIKDKVLLPFGDHLTLLEWKLEQLCRVLPAERIYVSTDSENLKRLAAPFGVRLHDREPRLCRGHEAAFSEVITGIVKDIPHDHVAWVTVVVPLMSPAEYGNGFQKYHEQVVQRMEHDSLFAANLVKEYLWWPDLPLNYQADRHHTISQHLPDIYRVTNGLYMRDKASILRDGYFLGPNPFKFLVSKVAGVDIDVLEDFQIARSLRWLYEEKSVATGTGMNNLCLATNYLVMTPESRQMWIDLDRHLEEFGSRLALMTSAEPKEPLPFPVIPIPFLLRDYAGQFPHAGGAGGNVSAADMELLQADSIRANKTYPSGEALNGMFACRKLLTTVLDTLRPGYVLTWDPTSPLAHLLQSLARESGLPIQGIERGLFPETLMVESRSLQGYSDLRTHWLAQEIPLSASDPAAYERIRSYYLSRKPQKYDQPEFGGGGKALRQSLGLDGKKVIIFLGHYDACGLAPKNSNQRRYHSPVFDSTADALMAVGNILARNPGVAIVFKPHPLDADPYAVAKIQGVHIVRDVNVHALIEMADVVATQLTTLQFEAALYEKPIVLLGHSAWWGRNATYEVDRLKDLSSALDAALNRQDWNARQANAHAFVTWIMDQFLIGCTDTVPARRNLRDIARFIARTSLDSRHLPTPEERWRSMEKALEQLRPAKTSATAAKLFNE